MAGSRSIQDQYRHIRFDDIQHRCNQGAGIERNCLTGLKIDFKAIRVPDMVDQCFKSRKIIPGPGDVVPTAKVYPFEFWQIGCKRCFKRGKSFNQRGRVLLA